MVDDAIDPKTALFISCALIAVSLILGMIYILRRRDYGNIGIALQVRKEVVPDLLISN